YGARRTISSPSWLATHPPTPMSSPGLARLRGFTRPRSAKTFSWAFSRTEHVGHLVRVVLVHLASERADVDLLRRHASWGRRLIRAGLGGVGIFPHRGLRRAYTTQ